MFALPACECLPGYKEYIRRNSETRNSAGKRNETSAPLIPAELTKIVKVSHFYPQKQQGRTSHRYCTPTKRSNCINPVTARSQQKTIFIPCFHPFASFPCEARERREWVNPAPFVHTDIFLDHSYERTRTMLIFHSQLLSA